MNAAVSNQKTVPLLLLDKNLMPSKNKVDTYRTLVAIALKENLPPLKVETSGLERLSMFLQPVMFAKVELAAAQNKMTFQEAFAGLTAAGMNVLKANQRELAGVAAEIKAPFNARPEQLRYYQGIQAGLQRNKIVMAEASTGVGKGRALCAVAIEAAHARKAPVVIAAPTLKVLGQLWKEMDSLRKENLGDALSYSFYPGASEFVDDDKLSIFMNAHHDDPAVAEWLKNKGSMLEVDNPLRNAMKSMGINPSFLMEDLRTLAVNMDVEDYVLRGESECETTKALKDLRAAAINADIIFCTHTMLAMSHRLKWALVPLPAVLLIDEAHQFEQNVANVHSDGLSLYSLVSRLKHSKSPAKAVKAVHQLTEFLQTPALEGDSNINIVQSSDSVKNGIKSHLNQLASILKSKTYSNVDRINIVRRVIANTQSALEGTSSDSAYISFSPDRRYPTISTGKSNLGLVLGSLWKEIHGGAVLASATLYIKNQYGEDKCDYICDILAIPSSRLHITAPVIAEWMTSIPQLHTPSETAAKLIARPFFNKGDSIEAYEILVERWLNSLAAKINKVADNAKGGTLVLATSYAQLSVLNGHLIGSGIPSERIFMQERNKKISATEQAFREAHKNGLRPIWLALGAAWTGLDLKETNAEIEDTVLTDLVILCCPIGMNRTNTMNARIEARSMNPIIKEALMMLKQGLGRLMRDPTQTDRNIWFLDGRIFTEWKGMEELQKSVIKLLMRYKKQKNF